MSGIVELCSDKTIESLQKICKEENGRFHAKKYVNNMNSKGWFAVAYFNIVAKHVF